MRYSLLTSVAVLLLAACSHVAKLPLPLPTHLLPASTPTRTLADAKKDIAQATPCCTSFADFSYQKQLPWRPQRFELGAGSPVAAINGARSYFLAFALPPETKMPYKIGLKSEISGRSVQNTSYLFGPTVAFLDAAFQPVDSQEIKLCEYMGWSTDDSGAFGSATVSNPNARYVVIYSSAKQQANNTYWEQSGASFSASSSTPATVTTGGSYKIQHGPDGVVWVGLMDRSYNEAVKKAVCGKPPQGNGLLSTLRSELPLHAESKTP